MTHARVGGRAQSYTGHHVRWYILVAEEKFKSCRATAVHEGSRARGPGRQAGLTAPDRGGWPLQDQVCPPLPNPFALRWVVQFGGLRHTRHTGLRSVHHSVTLGQFPVAWTRSVEVPDMCNFSDVQVRGRSIFAAIRLPLMVSNCQ